MIQFYAIIKINKIFPNWAELVLFDTFKNHHKRLQTNNLEKNHLITYTPISLPCEMRRNFTQK